MKCCQCSKAAVFDAPPGPLCLDCTVKYQRVVNSQLESQERMINFLMDEMEMVSGVRLGGPRFPERKPPVIQAAPVTMNNINIDRSIVGSVNTGYVKQLEVSINTVTQGAEKIKAFAEGVLKNDELTASQKEDVIQQLDYLTQQLRLPPKSRNMSVIKAVGKAVVEIVNLSASLVGLWTPIKSLLGL